MIEELFSNSQVKVGNFVFQKAAKVFASSLALNKKNFPGNFCINPSLLPGCITMVTHAAALTFCRAGYVVAVYGTNRASAFLEGFLNLWV